MPAKLRNLSGDDVLRILATFGFAVVSQRGSHVKLRRVASDGRKQTLHLPRHGQLRRGTLTRHLPASGGLHSRDRLTTALLLGIVFASCLARALRPAADGAGNRADDVARFVQGMAYCAPGATRPRNLRLIPASTANIRIAMPHSETAGVGWGGCRTLTPLKVQSVSGRDRQAPSSWALWQQSAHSCGVSHVAGPQQLKNGTPPQWPSQF